jgi:fibronectin-binding autotransporter adhesin
MQEATFMACLVALALFPAGAARADTLVWDANNGTAGSQDGGGTWTTGLQNWFNTTFGLDNQVWVDGSDAVFGSGSGAAGTVTLGGPVSVGDLTFAPTGSGTYTIAGSDTLTLVDSLVTMNASAAISARLAGSTAWAKSGSGQLTLDGTLANTHSGALTISAGRVHLAKTGGVTALAGDVILNGTGTLTFSSGTNQIASTANVTVNSATSAFNGTGPNAGPPGTVTQTLASLTMSGGTFNTGASSVWNIGAVSFSAGENRVFVGNSGAISNFGSLSLVGMNGGATATAVANGFTIFGNGTVRTSLTIGAGGLYLENSRIHLSRGSNGSGLYLNGDVSTGGTATSFLQNSQTGAVAPLIGLSGVAGVVSRTFDIAGGGANLDVDVAVTNGAALTASIVKTGAGVLSFLGADANSYTGTTTINGGTLRLGKTSGVTSVVGDIVVGTGGTLQLSTNHQIADTAGITLNGGTMTGWASDETIAFFTQNSGGLATSGNTGHVTVTGALTLAGGNTLVINSNPGSTNPASWSVGSALLSGADILIGGTNGPGNPRTSLTIGAGGLTMLGRNITLNAGNAGTILNLNGDFTGSGNNNIVSALAEAVTPRLEIGSATRTFEVLSGTTTIGMEIGGTGGSLVKTGAGLLQLTAANTYSGLTRVSGGTLSVAAVAGSLANTSGIVVENSGIFRNGSPTPANNDGVSNRLNPAAGLSLGGGTYTQLTAASGAHGQSLTGFSITGGANTVDVTAATATTSTLTFTGANPYTRTGGLVNFVQNPADGGSIVFSNAPSGAGNVSDGVLVGATLNGTDLILAQAGVLTAFAGWMPTGTNTWNSAGYMDVTGTNPVAYAAVAVGAIRFNTPGAFTVTLDGTHTVSSDLILVTPNTGANLSTITGGQWRASSGSDLAVAQHNTAASLEIGSSLVDHGGASGLVKSGAGRLILTGANTYSGDTFVSEGILRAGDGAGLTATSALILSGGAFESSAALFTRASGSGAGQVAVVGGESGFTASGNAVTVNLGGSGATTTWGSAAFAPEVLLLNAVSATAALEFANALDLNGETRTIRVSGNTATLSGVVGNGAVGSPAGLVKIGGAVLRLTAANTFDGGITVSGGTLALGHNSAAGPGTIILDGGALQADGGTRTIANPLWLRGSATLSGTSTLRLTGPISGGGSFTKTGTSVVEITTDTTHTGTTNVSNGILRLLSNGALGSTGGATTASSSGTVELDDGVVITGETITVSSTFGHAGSDGSPTGSRGGLQAGVNATAEWAGNIILGGNQARIGVQEGGTLLISGNITDGVNAFRLRLSGELTGNGGVILASSGNSWDGGTDIVRGTITLGATNAIPVTSDLDIHFVSSNNTEYAGLNLNGFDQTVTSLRNGGNSNTFAELTNRSETLSTFTINETGTATYGGIITGNLALVKNGSGISNLSRTNSFTGGLTVNEGTLQVGNSGALSFGNVIINGGALAAGKLDLNNVGATANSLNGAAGTVAALIANESVTNAVRTLTVGIDHGDGAFAGSIIDNGGGAALGRVGLAKVGTGTQILSGIGTYTGDTLVNNGTLIADFSTGTPLGSGSTIRMQGGTLVIRNATTATIGNLALTQTGTDFTSGVLRIEDGATITTDVFAGTGFVPFLFDLRDGATLIANTLSGAAVTNDILVQGGSSRGTLYVADDSGIGFATRDGGNAIVRYTGATALTASNSSASGVINYRVDADLTRTAGLGFHSLQIDTSAADVTLNMGSGNLTVGSTGRGILFSGSNDATITGSGAVSGGSVFFANYSSGVATIDISLAGQATIIAGTGLTNYTRTNNTADLYVAGGVFRMSGADRDFNSGITRLYGGGILEIGADLNGAANGAYTRGLGQAGGQVALIGNAGFSAHGADRVVALGGVGTATPLVWGTSNFLSGPGGDNNYAFKLGSDYSSHTLEFQNAIDLGVRDRIVEVADGVNAANVDGRLTGALSGSGDFIKTGSGTLELTGGNLYTGRTLVRDGTLLVSNTTGSGTGTGDLFVEAGATLGGTGTIAGDTVVSAGAILTGGRDGTADPGGPGTIGELTFFGDLDSTGSSWLIDLVQDNTLAADHINGPAGNLNITNATLGLILSGSEYQFSQVYTIASYATLTGTFSGLGQDAFVIPGYQINYGSGLNSTITLIAVPEPATLGLLTLALGGLYAQRRRKR